jgi:transcriptional regulator with XRE-family HTH domain
MRGKMSSIMDILSFSDWLQRELNQRGLSQAELARLADINRQVISTYINQKRINPDEAILRAIARAFKIPPETVFRAAGLLPPVSEKTERVERILHLLETMPEAELDGLEIQIAALASRHTKIKPKTGPLRGQP